LAITHIQFLQRFHPLWGFAIQTTILPKEAFQLPAHFNWRKNGKNAVAWRDGIGFLDIKTFFSCVVAAAKSHHKLAEAYFRKFAAMRNGGIHPFG